MSLKIAITNLTKDHPEIINNDLVTSNNCLVTSNADVDNDNTYNDDNDDNEDKPPMVQ